MSSKNSVLMDINFEMAVQINHNSFTRQRNDSENVLFF